MTTARKKQEILVSAVLHEHAHAGLFVTPMHAVDIQRIQQLCQLLLSFFSRFITNHIILFLLNV